MTTFRKGLPGSLAISSDTTIPAPSSNKTGTITLASGNPNITGSSTLFTTEVSEGDWIYVNSAAAGARLFQVEKVNSDTSLTLSSMTVPAAVVSGSNFKIVKTKYHKVDIFPSDTSGKIFGQAVGSIQRIPYHSAGGVTPIEIDGSGSHPFFVTTLIYY